MSRQSIRTGTLAVALFAITWPALSCWDANTSRPLEREEHKFHVLLSEENYAELERLGEMSLDGSAAIADGQPLRMALMGGLDVDDAGCKRRAKALDEERTKLLEPHRAKLEGWLRAYPASRTAQLAMAVYPMQVAYVARGNEYANKVPDEAWAIHRREIERVRVQLEALPPGARKDPEWHHQMLKVARDQSWPDDRYQRLLDEATSRFPTYAPLYFEASMRSTTKWGGSDEKLRALIDYAASRTRAASGETFYARLQWSNKSPRMFADGQAKWPRMKEGFERLVKEYPDPWNLNNYGKFACMAMDARTLREILARIDVPVLQAWESMESWVYCKNLAANAPVSKAQ